MRQQFPDIDLMQIHVHREDRERLERDYGKPTQAAFKRLLKAVPFCFHPDHEREDVLFEILSELGDKAVNIDTKPVLAFGFRCKKCRHIILREIDKAQPLLKVSKLHDAG